MASCKSRNNDKSLTSEVQKNLEKLKKLQGLPECDENYVKQMVKKTGQSVEYVIAEYLAKVEKIVRD
ncbi:MAG: hypothetical protein J6J23_06885 [Clostridia bacterium]|nr:hypothetical protein [Clostridia bacterium]